MVHLGWIGPFGPFRAIRTFFHDDPGRRCALPWARLCKPVGLSNPFALRAAEHLALRAAEQLPHRAAEHLTRRLGESFGLAFAFRPEWGSHSLAQGLSTMGARTCYLT